MEAVRLGPVLIMVTVGLTLLLNVAYLGHSMIVGQKPDYELTKRQTGAELDPSESAIFEEAEEKVNKMPYAHWRDVSRIQIQFLAIATGILNPARIEPSEHAKELVNALEIILAHRSSLKKAPLLKLYHEHVIEPCKDWPPATEKTLSLFGKLEKSSYQVEVPDKYVYTVSKTKICKYIIENDQVLQKHLRLDRDEIEEFDRKIAKKLFDSRLCTHGQKEKQRNRVLKNSPQRRYAESFLTICKMSMQDEVEENLRMISNEHKKDVEKLTEKLYSTLSPYLVKEFLESNFAPSDQESTLPALYQKHVIVPCKEWLSVFRKVDMPHLRFYDSHEDSYYNFDYERRARLFRDNLKKGRICDHILEGNLGRSTERLLNEKPKESGKGLFSRCFGRKKASS